MTEEREFDLEEWRALQAEGEPARLPSGLKITVKRVSVLDLAAEGNIPATLSPQITELMKTGTVRNLTMEDFQQFAEMINLVCRACILGPKGLRVEELPYDDRVALFTWANAPGTRLQTFRKPTEQPVDLAQSGNHLQPASKQLVRPRPK